MMRALTWSSSGATFERAEICFGDDPATGDLGTETALLAQESHPAFRDAKAFSGLFGIEKFHGQHRIMQLLMPTTVRLFLTT